MITTAAIVLAILVATPAAAAGPDATAGGNRVVLADGTFVDAAGEVERRDGLVVFRTAAGVLASLPAERVASIGPVPRAAPGDAPREPREGTGPGRPVPIYTDDDLPDAPPPTEVGGLRVDRPDPSEVEPLTYSTVRDRDGHGEAWWRAHVTALEEAEAEARAEVDRWSRSYREISALVELECGDTRRRGVAVGSRCLEYLRSQAAARDRLDDARARIRELERERAGLREEARRAGALPGWLRRP